MQLSVFVPDIDNYRGHCVAAIARSKLSTFDKNRLIRQLPRLVSYDEYCGLVGILCCHNSQSIWRMYNRLFRRFSLFGWIDGVLDFWDRIFA